MHTLSGTKLWTCIIALCLGLLLSTLETSIIATALVPISSDLGDFEQSNWVVVSYLLTYTGFLIIYARLSDVFGRKWSIIAALSIFTIFSLACGLAETQMQLIIFRAFQGVGGSGVYSLTMAVSPEISPPEQFGIVNGIMTAIFASSSILGPVVGGAITSSTTWRWVFWINVPCGAAVILLVFIVFPNDIRAAAKKLARLRLIDFPGCVFLLAASILIIFPLESGGSEYAWNSPVIIVTFVLGGLFWIAFVGWEAWLAPNKSSNPKAMLPIFPLRLVKQRVIGSALLSAFLTGYPFMTIIINLPQRFQIENGLAPVDAGVRMLPLLLLSAFASLVTGTVCSKKNVACYALVIAIALQMVGLGLMSSLPTDNSGTVSAAQYGYQVILGLGFGMSLTCYFIICRVEVNAADLAVTMGGITQVRVFGGVIGIAISQLILTTYVDKNLAGVVPPGFTEQLSHSPDAIGTLDPDMQARVRSIYGEGYNEQTRIVLYISAVALLVSLGTLRRNPPQIARIEEGEAERIQAGEESSSDQSIERTEVKLDEDFVDYAGVQRDVEKAPSARNSARLSAARHSRRLSGDAGSARFSTHAGSGQSIRSSITGRRARPVSQLPDGTEMEMVDRRARSPVRSRPTSTTAQSLSEFATVALIASTPWQSSIPDEYARSIASGSKRNSQVRMSGYSAGGSDPARSADKRQSAVTVSNRDSFVDVEQGEPSARPRRDGNTNTLQVWNMFWKNNRNSMVSNLSGSQPAEPEEPVPPPAYTSPVRRTESNPTDGSQRVGRSRSGSGSRGPQNSFLELDGDEASPGPSSPVRRVRSASVRSALSAHRRSGSMFVNQPLPVVPSSPVRPAPEGSEPQSYFPQASRAGVRSPPAASGRATLVPHGGSSSQRPGTSPAQRSQRSDATMFASARSGERPSSMQVPESVIVEEMVRDQSDKGAQPPRK